MAVSGGQGLFLAALAFLVLTRSGTKAPPTIPPGIPPTKRSALPEGGIGSVQVAQSGLPSMLQAYMGLASVSKAPGETLQITVTWTAGTRNSLGQAIDWPYAINVFFQHTTTLMVLSGGRLVIGVRPNGTYQFGSSQFIGTSFTGGTWNVIVELMGSGSTPDGKPTNTFDMILAQGELPSGLNVTAPLALRPTDQEIIAAAQVQAGVSEPIFSPSVMDTRFFLGLALLNFGLLTVTRAFIDSLPGTASWSWVQALDWWKTSGFMK